MSEKFCTCSCRTPNQLNRSEEVSISPGAEKTIIPINRLLLEAIVDQADLETFGKFRKIKNRDMAHYTNRRIRYPKRPFKLASISCTYDHIRSQYSHVLLDTPHKTLFVTAEAMDFYLVNAQQMLESILPVKKTLFAVTKTIRIHSFDIFPEDDLIMFKYYAEIIRECHQLNDLVIESRQKSAEMLLSNIAQRTSLTMGLGEFKLRLCALNMEHVDILIKRMNVPMFIKISQYIKVLIESDVECFAHFFAYFNFDTVIEISSALKYDDLFKCINQIRRAFPRRTTFTRKRIPRPNTDGIWQVIEILIEKPTCNHVLRINDHVNKYN